VLLYEFIYETNILIKKKKKCQRVKGKQLSTQHAWELLQDCWESISSGYLKF